MTSIYGFSGGPKFRGMTSGDFIDAAMDQPLSLMSTLFDQTKGGVLDSFGIGTAIQETFIPAGTGEGDTMMRRVGRELAGMTAIPIPGAFGLARSAVQSQINTDQKALSEDDYKRSPHFRKNIPWDAGMTEARAKALADWDDHREIRKFYGAKRPITAFIGGLMGQALDPINYIPIAGPAVKAAAIARAGRIGGAALTGSLDAAANTAIFGVATRETRRPYGSDVSWQATVSEIAVAALIGSAFGGIAGALEARGASRAAAEAQTRLGTLRTTQEARIALNEAIDAVVRGEPVALSPNATEPVARVQREVNFNRVPSTETTEFKTWFGDSKVVDEAGKPLVVYHGTSASFDQFDLSRAGSTDAGKLGRGFYFSARPDIASFYADRMAPPSPESGPNVMPVYLAIENPVEFRAGDGVDIWTKLRAKSAEWGIELDPVAERDGNTPNEVWAHAFTEVARERGHDGVLLKFPDGGHEIVAFDAGQIKSRFNVGPFDRRDPRIINATSARAEQPPEGRVQAEARIAKPDDAKAIAEQHAVHPETGEFPEIAEIDQLRAEGRLTADDEAALEEAQSMLDDAGAYSEALMSVTRCLL